MITSKRLFSLLALIFLAGCQSLGESWQQIKYRASYRTPSSSTNGSQHIQNQKKQSNYLVQDTYGKEINRQGQIQTSGANEGNFSKAELYRQVKLLETEVNESRIEKNRALDELKNIKRDYGKRIFELENSLEVEKREKDQIKEKKHQSELSSLKLSQEIDRIKLDIMRKKAKFNSAYPQIYEVRKGDSLWRIAARRNIYNDPFKYLEIYFANKDKIEDQDLIYPGTMLRIPRYYESLMSSTVTTNMNTSRPAVVLEKKQELPDPKETGSNISELLDDEFF